MTVFYLHYISMNVVACVLCKQAKRFVRSIDDEINVVLKVFKKKQQLVLYVHTKQKCKTTKSLFIFNK